MHKLTRENLIYMLLSSILIIGGYWFLRYAYQVADAAPFSQEIVLVILGTIITILITAILLNKQTEVELKKEENIKFIELKTDIYLELFDHLEQIILEGNVNQKDKIKLRILAHKLAIVSSPDVLTQFEDFLEKFATVTQDELVGNTDTNILMDELAELSVYIRQDLIGDLDQRKGIDPKELAKQIIENSETFKEKV
jgi:hypothetical protein